MEKQNAGCRVHGKWAVIFATWLLSFVFAASIFGQTTEFTYQGSLKSGGTNANGSYDFIFVLFDSLSGGNQLGSQLIRNSVVVADGQFAVNLDFGSQFPGANRFMQILVRQQPNIHTQLEPRQQINSTPYSIKSLNAENAATSTNALQLGGVTAAQYVLTGDARMSDARNPLAGSPNYVANTTPGSGFSFNINGTGAANILDATTQFNLAGGRILANPGTNNLFAGINAGAANTGSANSFFGRNAGRLNTSGFGNSFFGTLAGDVNTTGGSNSFFGSEAGAANSTASNNSFFGYQAGRVNSIGEGNTFMGWHAGTRNTTEGENTFIGSQTGEFNGQAGGNTAIRNTFVGSRAGLSNTTGGSNSFFGNAAGANNSTASQNSFFGDLAGFNNTTGNSNAFFGYRAGTANSGSGNSFFGFNSGASNSTGIQNAFAGAAAGSANTSGSNNTYMGYNAGFSNTTTGGNTFFGWRAGFSSTGGSNSFFGSGSGATTTSGNSNAFFAGGGANTTGNSNSFFGVNSGQQNTTGSNNTFIGAVAGGQNTTGSNNIFIGNSAGNDPAFQVSNSVAIGANVTVSTSNTIVLGTTSETTRVAGALTSGYFTGLGGIPAFRALASPGGGGVVAPNFYLTGFSQLASPNHLCWRAVVDGSIQGNAVTNCTGAFGPENLKAKVRPFSGGLNVIKQLRPVSFEWKEDGTQDIGLNAEDVAAVEPDLVTRNAAGEAESVKEHSLDILFINALKEQQRQIEVQQIQIELQRKQIESLTKNLCEINPKADICRQ